MGEGGASPAPATYERAWQANGYGFRKGIPL